MGNGASSSNSDIQWRIDLEYEKASASSSSSETEDLSIQAGKKLKGSVHIRLTAPRPFEPMFLRFTGMELIQYKGREENPKHRSERLFCATNVRLSGIETDNFQDGTLRPGTYIFPFDIKLPKKLPSSMGGKLESGEKWDILYRLAVKQGEPKRGVPSPTLFEKYLKVASCPLPDEKVPAVIMPEAHKVESMLGMRDRGSFVVAAHVPDVHVGRGKILYLYLAARNDANASIHKVEIELLETVTVRDRNSNEEKSTTDAVMRLDDVDLPGIQKTKLSYQSSADRMNDLYSHLADQIKSKKNRLKIKIPCECIDSYKSKLIKVDHSLRVTMRTNNRTSNPSIDIPLRIGYPPQRKKNTKKKRRRRRSQAERTGSAPETANNEDANMPDESHDPPGTSDVGPTENEHSPNQNEPRVQSIVVPALNADADAANLVPLPPPIQAPSQDDEPLLVAPLEPPGEIQDSHSSDSEDSDQEGEEEIPVARMVNSVSIRSIPGITIPVVEATLVPSSFDSSAVFAGLASAPSEDIIVGHMLSSLSSNLGNSFSNASNPELDRLLHEMRNSLDDYDIIASRLATSGFLESISAKEFGQILSHVNIESEKSRVAALLACHLGTRFTTFFVREAARNCASWDRVTLVPRLMPFCSDLPDNIDVIRNELQPWEQQYIQEQMNL